MSHANQDHAEPSPDTELLAVCEALLAALAVVHTPGGISDVLMTSIADHYYPLLKRLPGMRAITPGEKEVKLYASYRAWASVRDDIEEHPELAVMSALDDFFGSYGASAQT